MKMPRLFSSQKERANSATPVPRATIQLEPSDSEDEEVIFTRSMVSRLNKKIKEQDAPSGSTPKKSESMSSTSNSSTPCDCQRTKDSGTPNKNLEVDVKSESSENTLQSVPEDDAPLTPRTRDRILQEIAGVDMGASATPNESQRDAEKRKKKYYFRRAMNIYNNTVRILENRKEESLWKEEYEKAEEIEQNLEKLYAKEAPLRELLVERLDVLNKKKYKQAQQLKDKFDATLEDAVDLNRLKRFFTKQEMERLKEQQRATEDDLLRD